MGVVALDWPAPASVKAFYTTRDAGYSAAPYDSFNLGLHVNDQPQAVQRNRQRLRDVLLAQGIPASLQIHYLQQVHGVAVYDLDAVGAFDAPDDAHVAVADAAITSKPDHACLVMTADCLPVFFTDVRGDQVAVAHAGWRGLAAGVLQQTLSRFHASPGEIMAYLGPAIGPANFEVGAEVRQCFLDSSLGSEAAHAFAPSSREQHYLADLYRLATLVLQHCGVQAIYGGGFCTYADAQQFFSYRRDDETGRMAHLILKTVGEDCSDAGQ